MLTFLHGHGGSELNTVHNIDIPLTDLNLPVVKFISDFITASSAVEVVYGAAER